MHSKKLLLADDKPELLKMVSAILADEGVQRLVTAANFAFVLILLLVNILAFALTFGGVVFGEYGSASPANMSEAVAADLSASGISEEMKQELNRNQIWAMYLSASGRCDWSVSLPGEVPAQYTIQDVAVFSKGDP